MTKRFDVVSTGECLIDVLLQGSQQTNAVQMVGNAGGAPVNVLAALTKLGCTAAYLAKLSTDAFGKFLLRIIEKNNINTEGIVYAQDHTTLAMVSLNEKGDRDFSFYRENTADVNYTAQEVNTDVILASKIFHFGSVSMVNDPSRTATLWAARFARDNGVKVSFDPNLRPALWGDVEVARPWIEEGLKLADYVKVSEEELVFLTGKTDFRAGAKELLEKYPIAFLAVTLGADGCACFAGEHSVYEPTYDTKCVDTTGSGDACWGAMLSRLVAMEEQVQTLGEQELRELALFANAAGSLCASRYGAIFAMGTRQEIEACMNEVPRLASRIAK